MFKNNINITRGKNVWKNVEMLNNISIICVSKRICSKRYKNCEKIVKKKCGKIVKKL